MKVVFYPEFETLEQFNDIYYRAVWHFTHAIELNVEFMINPVVDLAKRHIPKSFDSNILKQEESFFKKATFNNEPNKFLKSLEDSDVIMKWQETEEVNSFLSKFKNKRVYRVDPGRVRQEGSFYIQCVFDTSTKLTIQSKESQAKFSNLCDKLGKYESSWILATGPSVEEYSKHSFEDSLVIACNSTVLDDDLFKKTSPKILVFADPIFHFGASRYAAEFRKIVLKRLETSDISIVIPLKYYSLLTSIFSKYTDRIIGLEFDNKIDFNLDLKSTFKVKTTSNILTLLLFPLATTFSKKVNVLGCDGRPFENDDYFWGHGKSVQINSEMDNIQEVHPGFFKIDYNEYYFEHCHILDVMIDKAVASGIKVRHLAPSHIPALRDTYEINSKGYTFDAAIILEPDGIGLNGHYVPWHNQLINELKQVTSNITVLCNKKQDVSLYTAEAVNTFTSHSWAISRSDWAKKKNFEEHASYQKFATELELYLADNKERLQGKVISIFCYYGSIQILNILNSIKRRARDFGFDLKVAICLFHESVILDDKQLAPVLPPQSRTILLEAQAQRDSYNVRAVTERLSHFLYDKIEVSTQHMANPLPAPANSHIERETNAEFTVLFPCALRPEKGSAITQSFIAHTLLNPSQLKIVSRKLEHVDASKYESLSFIPENVTDDEYRMLLANSDLIVIPYLAPQFAYRTSGIIVDAMLAGKPVVTIQDTWLSDIVKKHKFGLSIKYLSPFSMVSAINTIKNNYDFFASNAKSAFMDYNESNSWAYLIRSMFFFSKK
ncbi:hypothetical protein MHM87_18465 [Alteromonas sp. Cnat3-28]|uniref:glycosyltransferase n=1 Tax=Alteromonas sp. Cnat3-28 TaxID=2917729 RepID=UPI001EF54E20|nr:hypothetical protein [Alteromonas sp. Cnat3-28]MCG7647558.1 hypothetical protein [Alteromonas sp. Cnat3-28]